MTWPTSPIRRTCCSTPVARSPESRFTRCKRRPVVRVVVCTVVHHPADARIFYREIRALLDAGHDVTYIAPHGEPGQRPVQDQDLDFSERSRASTGAAPDTAPTAGDPQPGTLRTVTIPRAVGRRRIGALRAAKSALAAEAAGADLLLVHDPEILPVLPARRARPA